MQDKSKTLQGVPPSESTTGAMVMWGMSQPYQERMPLILAHLIEKGVGLDEIVEISSVPRELLAAETFVLTKNQRIQLLEAFARLAPDDAFAVEAGRRVHLSLFGMLGYGVLCSETVRDAWNMMQRYAPTTNSTGSPIWREDGGVAYWSSTLEKSLISDVAKQFVNEYTIGTLETLNQDLMEHECWPIRICLMRPRPSNPETFEHLLGCPVEFGQQADQIYYERTLLEQQLRMANSVIVQEVERSCEALLKTKADTVTNRVCRELTRVPGHFPDIDAVADKMHMTSRTLRRRLSDEGTTFSTLRDETRLALARHYLRQGVVCTEDIAGNLGFSDANSFRQAFKRWTGCSPARYQD